MRRTFHCAFGSIPNTRMLQALAFKNAGGEMLEVEREILKALIQQSPHVEFSEYGEGCSESWIIKAENYLGYELPDSYKWWLKNFGGGEVGFGNEIYSIYGIAFETVLGGDIVSNAISNKKNLGLEPSEKLYLYEGGHHQAYFDIKKGMKDGEYEVIENSDGRIIVHKNFCRFLSGFIESHAG